MRNRTNVCGAMLWSASVRLVSLIALLPVALSMLAARPARAQSAVAADYRQFLVRLGFEEYSSQIRANRAKGTGIHVVADKVAEFQQHRYEIVDHARELATSAIAVLSERPDALHGLIRFAAEMAALQPVNPPTDYPAQVEACADAAARKQLEAEYIFAWIQDNVRRDTIRYTADLAYALYGTAAVKELAESVAGGGGAGSEPMRGMLKQNSEHLLKIVSMIYLDTEMGQCRYAGTALAAVLLRYARAKGIEADVRQKLAAECEARKIRLENVIGDTIVIDSAQGPVTVQVRTGDIALERSFGREAGRLGWAVRPSPRNLLFALRNHLVGLAGAMVLPRSDTDDSTKKSWFRDLLAKMGDWRPYSYGFSHVGMVEVKQVEGIAWTRVMDLYPSSNSYGGVRIIDFNQFAYNGPFVKLGIVRYDPVKFLHEAQRQARTTGYQPKMWVQPQARLNDGGHVEADPAKPKEGYTVEISREQYEAVASVPDSRAPAWYAQLMDRAAERFHRFLTVEFLGFNESFGSFYGLDFCSDTVWLAVATTSGFDLQKYKDHWNLIVKVLDLAKSSITAGIDAKSRIISPMGYMWQKELLGQTWVIEFPGLTPVERTLASSRDPDEAMDPITVQAIKRLAVTDGYLMPEGKLPWQDTYANWLIPGIRSAIATSIRERSAPAAGSASR